MTSRTLARTGARIAVLVALGGAITSCSGGEEPAATTEEDAAVDPAEDTAGDEDAQDAGDAGSAGAAAVSLPYTEELQGRRLTVESFGTSTPATEDFWEVADGNEAFYVQVRMENVEAEPWEFNMVQFFLFDESGEDYATEFFPVEAGEVPEARMLDVGDAVEGYIPFEVPAGRTGLRLEVAVDLSAGDVITVQLN